MSTKQYRNSFFASIGIHIVILLLLFVGLPVTKVTLSGTRMAEDKKSIPIEAMMVDQNELNKEVNRLAEQEANKVAAEKRRAEELKQQELKVAQKRKKEEEKLSALKAQQENLQKQAAEKLKAEKAEFEKIKKAKEQALLEQKKAQSKAKEAEKQRQIAEQKAKEAQQLKDEAEKLAKAQAAEKKKQAAIAAAKQQQTSKEQVKEYEALIQRKISQNWRQPLGVNHTNLTCLIKVKLLPTGEVLQAMVTETSGSFEFDRSAELAVLKSSPLPMPSDDVARAELRDFDFRFDPLKVG